MTQSRRKAERLFSTTDGMIPTYPLEAVDFFEAVVADQAKRHGLTLQKAQQETEKFYRLFMVLGMGHCSG